MLLMLSGCASSSVTRPIDVSLAEIPADIRVCFDRQYKLPPGTSYSKKQVLQIIAGLRRQDIMKSDCGRRLIAFYEAQK